MQLASPPESSSAWPSELSSSDCGCEFEFSEEPRLEARDGGGSTVAGDGRRALSSRGGDIGSVTSTVEVSEISVASRQDVTRAQRFVAVYVAPLWGRRMAALRRKCSPLWLYTGAACAAIVMAASFLLAPSANDHGVAPRSAAPLLRLDGGVRSRLGDDEHPAQGSGGRPGHEAGAVASADSSEVQPLDGGEDSYCQTKLVQELEESWNASELEFLAPRLVRNGSRAVLCFYDRHAHRLPPPYSYFPRQMALRYCTHAVYHAPFALHDGRLAYRNPGFDRQFGMPELVRVAHRRGFGTQVLFTVGGEETDNANWSRLASDEVRREALAKDLKETLVSLGYDGVNLHWATPGGRCGRASDARALTDLVRLLRTRLHRPLAPRDFLLAVTLPPQEHFVEVASQLAPLAKLADFLVVQVCGWTRQRSRSRECSMLRSGSTVAALEGPEALRHKLARMSLDGHGRLCVAALDTHLDDPLGACGGAMSPLLKRLYEDPLEA
ncbi:uncharacterized protein [Dermacentor albipictus]|uniref:uncharacterized protein isoform X2 n=1 Tax=Dermacentor albipictus TaxID=60249 RepID=UPI0031FDB95E